MSSTMTSLLSDPRLPYYVGAGVVATSTAVLLAKKLLALRAARKRASKLKSYPANTVILQQIPRGPYAPSMSPFPLKLETYLRMAGIPYQNELSYEMSSKAKTPWIIYNGEEVTDSQFCIEYLNKKLGKDYNAHLTSEQRAIARAFQKMMEENTYWTMVMQRWVYSEDPLKLISLGFPGLPKFVLRQIGKSLEVQAHGHGMGRHSQEEVIHIAKGDMAAVSEYLGDKKFLMGDKPCETDCAMFGMLAQVRWQAANTPLEKFMKEDFLNLSAYCDRMRDEFWPDWDECNTAGGTKEATK